VRVGHSRDLFKEAKMAEPVKMPFALLTCGVQRHVLLGG